MSIEQVSTKYYSIDLERIVSIVDQSSPFVFLDTALPSATDRYSYLFTNPLYVISTRNFQEVPSVLERVETASKKCWVAGYMAYESSYALEQKLQKLTSEESDEDLVWFGVFDKPLIFDHFTGTYNEKLPSVDGSEVLKTSGCLNQFFSLSLEEYSEKIELIKRRIAKGDTYQVNFTFDVNVKGSLVALSLYSKIRNQQKVPFGALMQTGSKTVASFSPELFFRVEGNVIQVKPMKGTSSRGRFLQEDLKKVLDLKNCPKNRAENVMIVDLLRNDLGKICQTSSVKVSSLCEIETHRTVHQMTSTIEGILNKGIGFPDQVKALFPCGSVTGAPKIKTMEIISELETGDRGVYCGALGFLNSERAVFSVPIRTLQMSTTADAWKYRVGSGIVWDSDSQSEYEECQVKCKLLKNEIPPFRLFESLLFDSGKPVFLKEHKERLTSSASFFMYAFDMNRFNQIIKKISIKLGDKEKCKVRIFLSEDGSMDFDWQPIECKSVSETNCIVSKRGVESSNSFLFHKTTFKPWFTEATARLQTEPIWDVLFFNEKDQLTEGSRSNVFVKLNGRLLTPALDCGLLPGVLRRKLLERKICTEAIISREELLAAEQVYCGNSVRGLVKVNVVDY